MANTSTCRIGLSRLLFLSSKSRVCVGTKNGVNLRRCRGFHWTPNLSNSTRKSVTSKDTRLAGRLRFYKEVGVVEVSPPWEQEENRQQSPGEEISSPISAGVDGTASASGVGHLSDSNEDQLEWMLTPRLPGTSSSIEDFTTRGENDNNTSLKWFGITLDGRTMKTPLGQKLAVPSESLAYAIASEWDAQVKYLQPTNMPLMTLACTALDQAAHHPYAYQEQSLRFLPTDTVSTSQKKAFFVLHLVSLY